MRKRNWWLLPTNPELTRVKSNAQVQQLNEILTKIVIANFK
jgi:hypothetical protein